MTRGATSTMVPAIQTHHDAPAELAVHDEEDTAKTAAAGDLIQYTTNEVLKSMSETLEYCFSTDEAGGEEKKSDDDDDNIVLAASNEKTPTKDNTKRTRRIVVATKKVVDEEGHETLWIEDEHQNSNNNTPNSKLGSPSSSVHKWRKNKSMERPRSIKVVEASSFDDKEEQDLEGTLLDTPTTVGTTESDHNDLLLKDCPTFSPKRGGEVINVVGTTTTTNSERSNNETQKSATFSPKRSRVIYTSALSPRHKETTNSTTTTTSPSKDKKGVSKWASSLACFAKKKSFEPEPFGSVFGEPPVASPERFQAQGSKSTVLDHEVDFANSRNGDILMPADQKHYDIHVEFPVSPKNRVVRDDKDEKDIDTCKNLDGETNQRLEDNMKQGGVDQVKTVENVKRFAKMLTPVKLISPADAHNMIVMRDSEDSSDGSYVLEHEDPSFIQAPNDEPAELLLQKSWDSLIEKQAVDPDSAPNFQHGISRRARKIYSKRSSSSDEDSSKGSSQQQLEQPLSQEDETMDEQENNVTAENQTPDVVIMDHVLPGTPERADKTTEASNEATKTPAPVGAPQEEHDEPKDVIAKGKSPERGDKKKSFFGRMRSGKGKKN